MEVIFAQIYFCVCVCVHVNFWQNQCLQGADKTFLLKSHGQPGIAQELLPASKSLLTEGDHVIVSQVEGLDSGI